MATTREHIVKMIAKNNAEIKTYKRNLDENYLHHFEWVAKKIFKLEWKNRMLKGVLALFDDDVNIKDVYDLVERMKDRFKDDLITRTLMQSSSNPLANLTSLWVNECKQELIEEL